MTKLRATKRWLAAGAVCVAALGAKAQPVTKIVPDGKPHKFQARDRRFFIDDEPTLLVAGEMHFGRTLPADWETRILQAKAMGLNTLSFYLFWNICEPREGELVFRGDTDVRRMLQLCQKHGMWAILRPGPYCCAEWEYGGLPWWTAKYPEVKIRTNDPKYLAWCRRYLAGVAKEVADLDVSRGGPLLMVQIENEYGMIGRGNSDHLRALEQIFREVGFTGQLFTCDPFLPPASPATSLPGVIRGRNGLRNDRDYQQAVAANGDLPIIAPEVYTAWFSGWGQPIATRNGTTQQIVDWTGVLLNHEASFCYYMFYGGTTWGFYNGCNEYLPVQTSYDYRAPVDEAGRTTEKFRALRELLSARLKITPPAPPPDPEVITLPPIALTQHVPLLDTLPAKPTRTAARPVSMEDLDQDYGCVLYRKTFARGVKGTLELKDVMDYAVVMVNGRTVGKVFRGYGPDSAKVAVAESGAVTLDILVYNLGRISVIVSDRSQDRARKGLGGATLDGAELTNWQMYSLPLDGTTKLKASTAPHTGPTFYRGTFKVAKPAGTFLDLRHWGFGAVWVNGHNLGRFWDRGGVRSLFLPAAYLRAGQNEIVVLELHDAPAKPEIGSATHIIEEPAVPFAVVLDRPAAPPRPPAKKSAP